MWSFGDSSLALAAITHTYLLFHCSPYMGYMAVELLHPVSTNRPITVDSAGWYAGLLGTAFSAGRYVSFIPWKRIQHIPSIGVRKTLMMSLLLSAICSIWFGLSRSYIGALVARFCLGLSNTLSACVKKMAMDRAVDETMKIPRVSNDKNDQARHRQLEMAPIIFLSVMMWGSALGPFVGGMLSNPGAYHEDTILPDPVEDRYPFFLPNLFGSLLCLVSLIGVATFIPDECQEMKMETTRLLPPLTQHSTADERQTLLPNKMFSNEEKWKARDRMRIQLLNSHSFRLHLLAYWTFSFVVVCIDEAFPLFLIARTSGPGLSPTEIGLISSVAGLCTSFSQALSIEKILIWLDRDDVSGYYPGLRTAALIANVPSVMTPLLLLFNGGTYNQLTEAAKKNNAGVSLEEEGQETFEASPGNISAGPFIFLVLLMVVFRRFSSSYFSMFGIATGRIVPSSHRDEASRILTHGALMARSVAPVVAGFFVSVFMDPPGGTMDAFRLWAVIGLGFGLGSASFTFQLGPTYDHTTQERSERRKVYLNNLQRSQLHMRLWEVHYDDGSATVASKWRKIVRKVIAVNRMTQSHKRNDKRGSEESNSPGGAKQKTMTKRTISWIDHIFQPGIDLENAKFLILGTSKYDQSCSPHVLNPHLMESLQKQLPWSCAEQNFWLKYSRNRDGDSIVAMEIKIRMAKNTIVAVETLRGDVFGCFMADKWRKTGKFELCGESFLWRMKYQIRNESRTDKQVGQDDQTLDEMREIEVYPWTGNNEECQLFSDERIGAGGGGGGFGFLIEDGLWRGSSCPCSTYDNPCLVTSPDGTFEIANIEVWAMTPFLYVDEAEKSEASRRFISENVDPNSVTSAWAKYI
jgi:hypothetical protein